MKRAAPKGGEKGGDVPVEKKKKSADPSDSEDKGEPEQQTRQKVVRRFGGRADLIDEDDSDLAPQGASDTEPQWDGEDTSDYDYSALAVPSLAIEDFAGRYEIEYLIVGHFRERLQVQRNRAYVAITKTGEGRYYVNRMTSGYFSLERIKEVDGERHVKVRWRKSRMSCDRNKRQQRIRAYKEATRKRDAVNENELYEAALARKETEDERSEREDFEETQNPAEVLNGSIFFWNDGREAMPSSKDQLRVQLLLCEHDGGYQFLLRKVRDGDGNAILRVAKRVREELSIDENERDHEQEVDEDEDDWREIDDDEDEGEPNVPQHRVVDKGSVGVPAARVILDVLDDDGSDEDDKDNDNNSDYLAMLRRVVRRSAPSETDDLAPPGDSEDEPNWDGDDDMDAHRASVYDLSLTIADFAGRYEVIYVEAGMEDSESKIINKKRAYAEITPTGEGKLYVDKSVNVYFALEKVVHQDERKSSAVDILWTKGKLMRQCRTGRDQRYKNGEDNNTYEGDILFTDKSKKNVTLYLREENDECEDGMCILLKRITA